MSVDLALEPCGSYEDAEVEQALRQALGAIDGLAFVRPGMRVAVKVNLVTAMKPDSAATVHPALVCALVRLLRERGAEVVIGDSPSGLFNAPVLRHVYEVCGMKRAEDFGAELNEDFSQAEAEFPEGAQARRFPCTAWLTKADAVVDLCKLKTHGMMGLTCAVKNFFGAIPGMIKPEFHYRYPNPADFADMLVDLYEYFKPRLCVCDAVIGMEGNGPTQGRPRRIGCLLAAKNGHLLDLAAAELIGLGSAEVPTLRAAIARGLCPGALSAASVSGDPARFRQADFQTVPAQSSVAFLLFGSGPIGRLADRFARRVLTPFPQLHAEACVGCGKCASLCPAKAITMKNRRPQIDRGTCIHCFCCQEFCPKGAMRVGRHALLRLLSKAK